MEKNTLIIVEGAQGAGKTTLTNYLRENLSSCDLHRLTGIKDKTKTGLDKVSKRFDRELRYISEGEDVSLPIMLYDRNFFTDEIYARLGYKEYSFSKAYNSFLKRLNNMNLNIYLLFVYLDDTSLYKERLDSRTKFEYQKFASENSIKQQEEYLKMATEIENTCKNIKVIRFENSEMSMTEQQIQKLFGSLLKLV